MGAQAETRVEKMAIREKRDEKKGKVHWDGQSVDM